MVRPSTAFLQGSAMVAALLTLVEALPRLRKAPEECPLQNGNLLDTILFVQDSAECEDKCSNHEECLFFYYYPGSGSNQIDATNQPAQCFLYDSCNRKVMKATNICPLNRENTVKVSAFVRKEKDCETSCASNELCGYYKHYSESDEKQPLMCYHLRSCSPRVIKNQACPLEKNNYIDHMLFTKTTAQCRTRCEDTPGCRFYYWYPIDYSPAPLYCYLFRSCEGGAAEPHVAIVAAGRHPGHYFLGSQEGESLDVVRHSTVCGEVIPGNSTEVGRAGAVSELVGKMVVVCGGRDHNAQIRSDCLAYEPKSHEWTDHSALAQGREEAASVKLDKRMLILGGFVEGVRVAGSEQLDGGESTWAPGPSMPEARSRFCAVALSKTMFAIVGGETEEAMATNDMKTFDSETNEFVTQPSMAQTRKDHACLVVEINDKKGIVVTGGVDENDVLLNSAEFYSMEEETWSTLSPMDKGRTEHGMALIAGRANVIGGVSDNEFLSSIEVLDNTADGEAPFGMAFGSAAHGLTRPRYDFVITEIPLSALALNERDLDVCHNDAVITSNAFLKK
eukprot:snap_masked-scaffold139_size317827-processed-gene-0.5 protein:Tk05001 transcript:snap_masked-scaffold139_size317827-processed-gene-0.5-mRNA-1 annotation:"kelch domain-containing protein"